jgi:hypothetical protein
MAKFEQKLQELGLQEEQLSVACKNLINDYRLGVDQLPTLEEENEGGELDQDIELLKEELENLDNAIVKKIVWFDKNKEQIAEGKGLRGRPKKNATPTATSTATPTPTATAKTIATPTTTPVATPNATEPKKKKGFGFGTFLLLVGGTILGVSLLNRNK